MKAYAAIGAFRAESTFSTWLYRIAFNIAANRWRTKKIAWSSLEDQDDIEAEHCELKQYDAKKDVAAAMKQLSAAQQLAIRLCYEEGFSHEEAAMIMSIPLGTLKTHVARGKQKLQVILAAWQEVA
jgi:RNA polymerase sigma factor (sigma-70 family)